MSFTVTQTGDLELELVFSPELDLDGAHGKAAEAPESYGLESLGVGATAYVEAVEVVSVSIVKLTISYATNAEEYRVEILGDVFDTGGSVKGETDDFFADVSNPTIVSAISTGEHTIQVTFDRDMKRSVDLTDSIYYLLTKGVMNLTISRITRISPTIVEIRVDESLESNSVFSLEVV